MGKDKIKVFSLTLHLSLTRTHYSTCTACLSYRDMEFIGDDLELGPDVFPFVVALCWFCSPSASIGTDDIEETSISQSLKPKHGRVIGQKTFDLNYSCFGETSVLNISLHIIQCDPLYLYSTFLKNHKIPKVQGKYLNKTSKSSPNILI